MAIITISIFQEPQQPNHRSHGNPPASKVARAKSFTSSSVMAPQRNGTRDRVARRGCPGWWSQGGQPKGRRKALAEVNGRIYNEIIVASSRVTMDVNNKKDKEQ